MLLVTAAAWKNQIGMNGSGLPAQLQAAQQTR